MKVYFVRHGETIFNKENRHQYPDTPLSSIGINQAKIVARRFSHTPIDVIVSSTYTRALQTAREIEKVASVPVIQNDLFIERRHPTEIRGKLHNDPNISHILHALRDNFHNPGRHHSDEENFSDVFTRAQTALEFIQSQDKERIAVVTHGYFLIILVFFIIFGKNYDPNTFASFRENTEYINTGLTMCEYVNGRWKLLTLNDYAHLGE